MTCSHARPVQRLRLNASLTIVNAAAEKGRLIATLRVPYTITELELGHVEEFDSAGLQLLLLACRMVEYTGGALRLADTSRVVSDVISLLRLEPLFEQAARNCPECAEAVACGGGT